ncbi:MAG: ubiquinone-binding protein [Proteobacteria bacterium]|nr:MAG: ubiquinone-binding protein [Pseudomonadota bacterium]
MREVHRSALVPYKPPQIFALVEDIERYPQFVPWVTGAQLVSRGDGEVVGRLEMAAGSVRERFVTRNTLTPPERIDMKLVEGPFKVLEGSWTFEPLGDRGTRIGLAMRFQFSNPMTALLVSRAFERSCSQLVDAFVARAHELYGTR